MLPAMVTVTHVDGQMERVERVDARGLLNELRAADSEHPDVAVSLDSGWSLGLLGRGRVFLEHLEEPEGAPRHLIDQSDAEVVTILELMTSEDFDAILRLPWRPGYPTVI